jgi:hypothetical protein
MKTAARHKNGRCFNALASSPAQSKPHLTADFRIFDTVSENPAAHWFNRTRRHFLQEQKNNCVS